MFFAPTQITKHQTNTEKTIINPKTRQIEKSDKLNKKEAKERLLLYRIIAYTIFNPNISFSNQTGQPFLVLSNITWTSNLID